MVLASQTADTTLDSFSAGLSEADRSLVAEALAYAQALYGDGLLGTGERILGHAIGMTACVTELKLDGATRAAALLFSVPALEDGAAKLESRFGQTVAALVSGISRLNELRVVTRASVAAEKTASRASQIEALRKMLLAMVEDVRVVLLMLASRNQTLRFLARSSDAAVTAQRRPMARETLDLYAPLANRLGVWQLKWELEDLSFRFLEPELYKRIAGMLDERRAGREAFIARAIADLARALAAAGVRANISGRPKHIYSIYGKMRAKNLTFTELHDVRALRVLVEEVRDCYTALGIVHDLWPPIPGELDDYIARPKENLYRSLHTTVSGPDGRALEVQIRTHDMHRTADLGVASHWRYKEGEGGVRDAFTDKIAMLRQMLAWRDEVVDASDWVEQYKRAALDDTIYALTPQGRVIDLPRGSTPVDFAYAVHTGLGHRCRGANVNGTIVPLDHKLRNGDRVEIIPARTGAQASGPSRDWMNPTLGYIASSRARNKVRQWFNTLDAAAGRDKAGPRLLQRAPRGEAAPDTRDEIIPLAGPMPRPSSDAGGITVLGVDRLLTQLARCCKPVPPDRITGFVTHGRGVSIHRSECASLARLGERYPDRLFEAQWGEPGRSAQRFPADVVVRATERPGLLRDISDVLARAQLRVSGLRSHVHDGSATLFLTVEVGSLDDLKNALPLVEAVRGVSQAKRR